LLDGILFERKGLPSASIVTEPFVETAKAMAKSWGVPEYKFVSIPHPVANLTEEELEQRARETVPKVAQLLLEGRA
jgi:hypothetical protein